MVNAPTDGGGGPRKTRNAGPKAQSQPSGADSQETGVGLWSWSAWVFFAAVLAFQPAFLNDFAHDDRPQVAELAPAEGATDWFGVVAQPWWPPDHHKTPWRPLTRLTIAVQKALHGDLGWPYYAFNLVLHAVCSVLLFHVARRIGMETWAAGLGSLIFAVHPIHAEPVHQIVGRAEVLAVFWMLVGLLLFARRPAHWAGHRWQQPLCFALALAAKEHTILYPVLLILAGAALRWRTDGGEGRPRLMGDRAWLGLLALLGGVAGLFVLGKWTVAGGLIEQAASVPIHENLLAQRTFADRLPAVIGIFGHAASRLVWPLGLCPDYSMASFPLELGWRWPWAWVGAVILVSLVVIMVVMIGRKRPGWTLVAAGLLTWGLTSNGLFPIGVVTAERLWYWPSAAACLGFGWGLTKLVGRTRPVPQRPLTLCAALAAVLLMTAAWHYAPAWRSQRAMAQWTIDRFPQSWRGHVNLAREDYQDKAFSEGLTHARQATEILPEAPMGWVWLGLNASFLPDRRREAEPALRHALDLDPNLATVHRNLANLYQMQGRNAEAARELELYLEAPKAADHETIKNRLKTIQNAIEAQGPPGHPPHSSTTK